MQARLRRALTERLCMVKVVNLRDKSINKDDYSCYVGAAKRVQVAADSRSLYRYDVLGSTGLLYHVRLSQDNSSWSCTCPDFVRRKKLCKHALLIICRVLRCDTRHVFVHQFMEDTDFNLLCSKALRIRQHACFATKLESNEINALMNNKSKVKAEQDKDKPPGWTPRRSLVDEAGGAVDCGICCEPMLKSQTLVHCETTCGNAIHEECYQQMRKAKIRRKEECVFCRELMFFPESMMKADGKRKRAVLGRYVGVSSNHSYSSSSGYPRTYGWSRRPTASPSRSLTDVMSSIYNEN